MTADDFDTTAAKFTQRVNRAANWKHAYSGAAYSTRIKTAIVELKDAIAEAERNPEIGRVVNSYEVMLTALQNAERQYRYFEQAYGTGDCEALWGTREAIAKATGAA